MLIFPLPGSAEGVFARRFRRWSHAKETGAGEQAPFSSGRYPATGSVARRLRAWLVTPLPGGPAVRPRGIMTPLRGARWTGNGSMVVGPPKRLPAHKGVTPRPAGPIH